MSQSNFKGCWLVNHSYNSVHESWCRIRPGHFVADQNSPQYGRIACLCKPGQQLQWHKTGTSFSQSSSQGKKQVHGLKRSKLPLVSIVGKRKTFWPFFPFWWTMLSQTGTRPCQKQQKWGLLENALKTRYDYKEEYRHLYLQEFNQRKLHVGESVEEYADSLKKQGAKVAKSDREILDPFIIGLPEHSNHSAKTK